MHVLTIFINLIASNEFSNAYCIMTCGYVNPRNFVANLHVFTAHHTNTSCCQFHMSISIDTSVNNISKLLGLWLRQKLEEDE